MLYDGLTTKATFKLVGVIEKDIHISLRQIIRNLRSGRIHLAEDRMAANARAARYPKAVTYQCARKLHRHVIVKDSGSNNIQRVEMKATPG